MDLDELRRKRVKLYDTQGTRQDSVASSSPQTSKTPASNMYPGEAPGHKDLRPQASSPPAMGASQSGPPDISEDEKYARQLQAEFEAEEQSHSNDASGLPSHFGTADLTQDEILANQLHEQFGHTYPSGDTFPTGPFTEIPGWAEMIAEDEQIARDLQAQFDTDDIENYDQNQDRSRSSTPQATVELPPTPPSIIVAQKIDDSQDAIAVREFASSILNVNCAVCNSAVNLDQVKLVSHFANVYDVNKPEASFNLKCSSCPGRTCPGCAERVPAAGNAYGNTSSKDGKHATWHCDRGRLALIWLILCGFDNVVAHNKVADIANRAPKESRLGSTAGRGRYGRRKGGSGIGYGDDRYGYDSAGYDYETDEEHHVPPSPPPPPKSKTAKPKPGGQTLGGYAPHNPNSMAALFPGALGPSTPFNFNTPPLPGSWPGPPHNSSNPSAGFVPFSAPSHPPAPPNPALPSYPTAPSYYSGAPSYPPAPAATAPSYYPGTPSYYPGAPPPPQLPAAPSPSGGSFFSSFPGSKGYRKRKAKPTKVAKVDPDDAITTKMMSLLSAILPSTGLLVPTEFDHHPPHVLSSILRRSSILDRAAALLHNDSLELATQRFNVYDSLIAFTRTLLAGGESMSSIVYESLQVNKSGHDLLKVSFGKPTRMDAEKLETRKSLASSMGNLAAQSKTMLSVMQTSGHTEHDDEQQMLLLATMISECADLVAKQVSRLQSVANVTSSAQENKNDWQKPLVVAAVPDHTIMEQHYYAKEAQSLASANPPRRRMARIFKELVSLQTDLPSGIFVRHGEGRPDMMKILIIGPEGTPYAHGMFEFDLFCPFEYPNVSPKMQIRTTGGGTVGFNPNLYHDGKVCLSLLGTWQGQGWTAGESTLLQVFVSIQAMIFNDEPWCNEPGRESQRGNAASKSYNRSLYPSVVKFAMLEWIECKRSKDKFPTSSYRGPGRTIGDDYGSKATKHAHANEDIWTAVTKKHFRVNADEIVKTVVKWTKDKPGPRKEPKSRPKLKGNAYPTMHSSNLPNSYSSGHSTGGIFGGAGWGSPPSYGQSFTGQGRTIGGDDPTTKTKGKQIDGSKGTRDYMLCGGVSQTETTFLRGYSASFSS